ncbi:FAD/NAD(P)-binding oxidoreductase [Sulfitobacter sp. JL08]|uniref:NAD(P)/FAD-dependent oxidoreductase n=1 Tax=Sulfitobacter sp. JL08 TaxID=2070369 RepID=UPI000E0C79AB|nr:NAD(P)/FAD-dependent oxidoreductase [Sulfitobacter sp. JL08]AXI54379.1 FAD/NAD(P)-binding oxidoreductase [Sulfitobacter sp. JL08]
MPDTAPAPDLCHDAIIIGGGVIGCAIARRLTLEGWNVALLEKAVDILDGASKGNSAILHTGFDAPSGSLEQQCVADGYAEYIDIHRRLNLSLDRAGALVIAWNDAEEAALPALMDQARANGVTDIAPLSAAQTRELEPELAQGVRASFRVPREYLVDPWSAPYAYLMQAVVNGARVVRNCTVSGGTYHGDHWQLETSRGAVRSRVVINAAGLYGDHVDTMLIGQNTYTIHPRKGQFVVYDKPAAALTRHILLPVPTKVTKGIVVCRTIWGNLLVGPTAEEQDARDTATLDPATLDSLRQRGAEILPALAAHELTALYAGLRPATEFKDYQISAHADRAYVSVGGIRSTGLSSALGTARHVHKLCAGLIERAPLPAPHWPQVPNLAEDGPRDWQCAGNGGIICHCEKVTRRDIETALSGPLRATSLAGLKRRTRVTMGRCQGNYCVAPLADITRGRLDQPIPGADDG